MIKRKDGFSGERAIVLPDSVVKEMESHPLASALHITDMGYYPQALYHYRERDEAIPQHVFIYCTAGKGWFEINGTRRTVEQEQCFVLPAGIPHRYGADETTPWTIYWIHFKGTLAAGYVERLRLPTRINISLASRIDERLELFEEIYRILDMGYSRDHLLYACSVFHHFLGTVCYLQAYRGTEGREMTGDLIDATVHYMKENLEKKLTVKDIAEHIGYSVSRFSAMFKSTTGYSPVDYFNRLKIQRACYLLDCADMRVNQVCYKIGISDCYYFSRLFSKVMGMSPKKYKQKKKG
ncbi:MAG: AraC family transcriptional regulator [Paraprevotella sp.]|nr:AraC family transcriptional regulator [Paraprevotella sp.]